MGTTRDALLASDGMRLGFVLCIEGYDYLLTSGDPDAAVAAWSTTPWVKALPGLQVTGNFQQSFRPFANDLQIPTMQFRVIPEETDQFGRDVFKSKPDFSSRLKLSFPPAHTPYVVSVDNVSALWAAGGAGVAYIGNRAYQYTLADALGGTFTIASNGSGAFSPFGTDTGASHTFPGQGCLPSQNTVGSWQVATPPYVSSSRRTWVGAKVGLWVHRISNGVWDTKDEAELLFAGSIDDVNEDQGGSTVLGCAGIQSQIEDTVLLSDQWTARVKEGFYIDEDQFLNVRLVRDNTAQFETTRLRCVSGASGTSEFEPGRYTIDSFVEVISNWLNNDGSVNGFDWSIGVSNFDAGARLKIEMTDGGLNTYAFFLYGSSALLQRLGFVALTSDDPPHVLRFSYSTDTATMVADSAPVRSDGFRSMSSLAAGDKRPVLALDDDFDGTYFDNTSILPEYARRHVGSGETWSFFTLDDKQLFLARKDSDTQLSEVIFFDGPNSSAQVSVLEERRESALPVIKQVAVITGSLTDVLTRLLASVAGNGVNHASYDSYPFGVGIPWELLGGNWVNSVRDAEETANQRSITLVIEKPTRLWDAIKSDLLLRSSFLVWKDGGIQLASMQTPNASNADWALDEHNKAVDSGQDSKTVTQHTNEFLTNNVKIEYNRDLLKNEFRDEYIVRDIPSIEDYGISRPLTVKARNSVASAEGNGASVEALADMITARFIPPFAKPVRRWRRSVSHNLFMAAPGDTVAVSDNFSRSPTTGERGISARAATVLSTSWSLGVSNGTQQYNGTMDLLYTEEDRLFPMSPSLRMRDFTGGTFVDGWDATNSRLAVRENEYSDPSGLSDIRYFNLSDEVRIIEVDPVDPSNPDTFTDTVTGTNGSGSPSYVQLQNGFGGGNPAFDSSKTYVVVSDEYGNADDSQHLQAYLADDATAIIDSTIEANLYGDDRVLEFSDADLDELPERHSDVWFGDGAPMSTHLAHAGARMCNNLVNHRCVSQAGMTAMQGGSEIIRGVLGTYSLVWCFPMFIGALLPPGEAERSLVVAPQYRSASGVPVTVRVTSSEHPPHVADGSWEDVTWRGTKHHATFSTSSTTQWTVPNGQLLRIARSQFGITWISVEVTDNTGFVSLAEIRQREYAGA